MAQEVKTLVGPFPSRMANKCTYCTATIHKFSPIYFYKNRRTQEEINRGDKPKGAIALHESCMVGWVDKQGETGVTWKTTKPNGLRNGEDGEDVEEVVSPVSVEVPATPATPANGDLLGLIAGAVLPLVQSQLKTKVNVDEVETIAQKIVSDALARFKSPVTTIEIVNHETKEVMDLGLQHKQFPALLKACQARLSDGHHLNLWIGGPAGSGKSMAGKFVAKALNLSFSYNGSFNESHKLFGYVSPIDGKYHSTAFRNAYQNGGAHMLDDFDGSDPVCAVELLGMLANDHAAFPDGMVERHKDFICLISANTFGHGATSDYVGRLKQDKALLNRFITFNWEYDEVLETATSGNVEWAKRVQQIRVNVARKGLKVLVTPRATYQGAALLAVGFSQKEVEAMVLGNAMTSEQWESVK